MHDFVCTLFNTAMLLGEKCIRCLLKIIYACDKEVVTPGTPKDTPKGSPSVKGGNSLFIKSLKEALYDIIAETVGIMRVEVSRSRRLRECEPEH